MRYMALIAALIVSFSSMADEPAEQRGYVSARTPRGYVIAYECKHIDPKVTGFSCRLEHGVMKIQLHTKQSDMTPEQRERANYEYYKIGLRYIQLGGRSFFVRADWWPPQKRRMCSRLRNTRIASFGCADYTQSD